MAVALYRSGRASIQRIRELFFPALVLAFGVVGWSHLYHVVVLGYADTAAGHAAHVLRDGLLAVPVALAALAGGLRLTRRRPLIAQAAGVAAVLGLLLVPATGLHDQIDARLAAAGQHHHLDAALAPAGQSHEAGGLLSLLEHGGRHALVAQVVALPLALMVLGRRGRRRPVRGRRVGWWPREVALASVSLLVLTGAGSTSNAVAAADTATVHQYLLTDNPGNWFDAGVAIAGTRSLMVVAPGDTVSFTVAPPASQELHTATSLLWPTGAANMPFAQPNAFRGTVQTQLTTPGLYVFLC
jgi:plastocyanin